MNTAIGIAIYIAFLLGYVLYVMGVVGLFYRKR
jgi:hypothetical protein